jgi:hypothetical protein
MAALPIDVLRAERTELPLLLEGCLSAPGHVDEPRFEVFRRRLLRLIAIEQRIVLPELVRAGAKLVFQKGMERDHVDLVTLCVVGPTPEWLANLHELLTDHFSVEERAGHLMEQISAHSAAWPDFDRAVEQLPEFVVPFEAGPAVRAQLQLVLRDVGLPWHQP